MKLSIFTSTKKDGIMSNQKKYFPSLCKEEIDKLYKSNIERFLKSYNQNINQYVILNNNRTKLISEIVTETKSKLKANILILKEQAVNLAVVVPTEDDPIIVASATDQNNKKVAVIAKGTINNINNNILHEMIEIIIKETAAPSFEITFYIGPCPSKESYIIKDISIINNKYLQEALENKNKNYYLDLRYAIFKQLYEEIVDPNLIYFDSTDTVKDSKYFSKIGNKKGQYLSCVVFTEE